MWCVRGSTNAAPFLIAPAAVHAVRMTACVDSALPATAHLTVLSMLAIFAVV